MRICVALWPSVSMNTISYLHIRPNMRIDIKLLDIFEQIVRDIDFNVREYD